ncbi:MAG: carbohydrate ABC transporter permease [Aggregatilineales bacterium]
MRNLKIRLFAIVLISCLLAGAITLHAQEGSLIFFDETETVSEASVLVAAQPLLDDGAQVLVYVVNEGIVPRMNELMEADGFSGTLPPNAIVLFISGQNDFSFLRFGSDWAPILGSQTATLRNQQIGPQLENGDFEAAVLATLNTMAGVASGTIATVDRTEALRTDLSPVRNGTYAVIGIIIAAFFIRWGMTRRAATAGNEVIIYTFLTVLAVFSILPFVWMTSSSFKLIAEIFARPPQLITDNMSLAAYRFAIDIGVWRAMLNTFVIALTFTGITLLFSTMAGFGFAKYRFPGRKALFGLLLAIMLVPGAVTIVPTYILMLEFGWIDTIWPLVVPGAANAYAIFFMRQYVQAVPDEIIDSARIDGCSDIGIYRHIIVPLVTPGMISLGLISFMAMWNNYFGPLIYLRSPENFTLPLLQMNIVGPVVSARPWPEWMAVGVISIAPTLLIYTIFQRRFTEGIAAGAVKM